jgi:MFS family permease
MKHREVKQMTETIRKVRAALTGNLGVMIATTGLWTVAGNLTTPFFALYVLELGGSYVNIGEIYALGAVIKVIPGFLGGYLADKVGRKRIVYTMTYLLASLALIRAFAPSYRWLVLAAVLEAVFMGFRQPSMSSIIGDSTEPNNRAMGYALMIVGPQLVGILSPSIIGVLMDSHGVRTAIMWGYIAVFALGSIAAFVRQRHLEETLTVSEPVTLSAGSLGDIVENFRETVDSLSRPFKAFLLADFIFTLALGLGDPYYVTYATEGVKLSSSQWGFITSLVLLAHCATLLLVAGPSDEVGRVRFVLASMISWPVTYLLFTYTDGFLAVMVVRIAITLSAAVGHPAWSALFVDFCPKEHRGRFNALTTVVWSMLYGGGNYLGGVLVQNHGVGAPFRVAAAFMAVGAVIAVFTLREPEKREA